MPRSTIGLALMLGGIGLIYLALRGTSSSATSGTVNTQGGAGASGLRSNPKAGAGQGGGGGGGGSW